MSSQTEKQTKKRLRKLKKKGDPNKPKRPPSGYQLFMAVHSQKYKEENPGIDQKDVMSDIARKWSELSENDKDIFQKQSATLKEEYDAKVKEYEDQLRDANGGVLPEFNKLSPEEEEIRRMLKRQRKEQRALRSAEAAEVPVSVPEIVESAAEVISKPAKKVKKDAKEKK